METIDPKLKDIIEDNKSGSKELLYRINQWFLSNFNNLSEINSTCELLADRFRTFQSIIIYIQDLKDLIELNDIDKLIKYLNDFSNNHKELYDKVYNNLRPYLINIKKIITHSNSQTVYEIISRILSEEKDLIVTVSEGRPQFEGRTLAEKLIAHSVKTELITEAMIPNAVQNINAALIGADIILANGNVVNKVGSLNLALACKYYNKPIYVISDKSKITNINNFEQADHPSTEIWEVNNDLISINNFYFEEIDSSLITKVITD